jgi:hypothetical protein
MSRRTTRTPQIVCETASSKVANNWRVDRVWAIDARI